MFRYADTTSYTDDAPDNNYDKKIVGKFLKTTSGWGDGNGEDRYGFSALPGGKGNTDGSFSDFGAYWWSSSTCAYYRSIQHPWNAFWGSGGPSQLLSVRCLKD